MKNIKEDKDLNVLNHSCAHLLAQAVKHLYPNAKFWVGPVIDDGFYYDIDLGDEVIKEEDLPKIEKEMKKIAKDGKRIVNAIKNQAACLDLMEYNQMLYFNLGLPLTYSGGLGIEKSLMYLLGLNHMISIQNPIGVDSLEKEYVRKLRREKK